MNLSGNAVTLKVDYPAASAEKWIGIMLEQMSQNMTENGSEETEAEESAEVADASSTESASAEDSPADPAPVATGVVGSGK